MCLPELLFLDLEFLKVFNQAAKFNIPQGNKLWEGRAADFRDALTIPICMTFRKNHSATVS